MQRKNERRSESEVVETVLHRQLCVIDLDVSLVVEHGDVKASC